MRKILDLMVAATVLVALAGMLAVWGYGQGLNTNTSKNDWEEINFEFNSAVLSDGYPSLLRLAELLKDHPAYKVLVEGNTGYFIETDHVVLADQAALTVGIVYKHARNRRLAS